MDDETGLPRVGLGDSDNFAYGLCSACYARRCGLHLKDEFAAQIVDQRLQQRSVDSNKFGYRLCTTD